MAPEGLLIFHRDAPMETASRQFCDSAAGPTGGGRGESPGSHLAPCSLSWSLPLLCAAGKQRQRPREGNNSSSIENTGLCRCAGAQPEVMPFIYKPLVGEGRMGDPACLHQSVTAFCLGHLGLCPVSTENSSAQVRLAAEHTGPQPLLRAMSAVHNLSRPLILAIMQMTAAHIHQNVGTQLPLSRNR